MRVAASSFLVAGSLCFFVLRPDSASAIMVTQWSLAVGISGSPEPFLGHAFTTVQNPFQNSHEVVWGNGTLASAQYDHSWSAAGGSFFISGAQAAQGTGIGGFLQAGTTGNIRVQLDAPLTLLDIDGYYQYNLGPGDRESEFFLRVMRLNPNVILWSGGCGAAPVFGDPPVGECPDEGTELLLTPGLYRVEYSMRLISLSGNPAILSTSSGWVHYGLVSIPECHTLALLAPALLLIARRRRLAQR